jgi:hypothetical protein
MPMQRPTKFRPSFARVPPKKFEDLTMHLGMAWRNTIDKYGFHL